MQYIMLGASGAVNVPEGFAGKVFKYNKIPQKSDNKIKRDYYAKNQL
jgi:hypothetical protein